MKVYDGYYYDVKYGVTGRTERRIDGLFISLDELIMGTHERDGIEGVSQELLPQSHDSVRMEIDKNDKESVDTHRERAVNR